MGFTDADGTPVEVPEPPPEGSFYSRIGAIQAGSYRRNSFAMGTEQEAAVLLEVLNLRPGDRVLDVGCGDGRHVEALRRRGVDAIGVDLSVPVLAGGRSVPLIAGDAASLPVRSRSVDAIYSVCQGGFGLTPERDVTTLTEAYRVLRTGGRMALSAFSLVFAARYMGDDEHLDAERGLHHHVADVRGDGGRSAPIDLWTTAYSPSHLRDLMAWSGFHVLGMAGAEPGDYRVSPGPTLTDPELLVWAERR